MISIGAIVGGPRLSNSPIGVAILSAMKTATQVSGVSELETGPAINAVFYVPGDQGSPPWTGIRDSRFSRKRELLKVEIAVPYEVVSSSDAGRFVMESLHSANRLACNVFEKKGIPFPFAEAEEFLDRLESAMRAENGDRDQI